MEIEVALQKILIYFFALHLLHVSPVIYPISHNRVSPGLRNNPERREHENSELIYDIRDQFSREKENS